MVRESYDYVHLLIVFRGKSQAAAAQGKDPYVLSDIPSRFTPCMSFYRTPPKMDFTPVGFTWVDRDTRRFRRWGGRKEVIMVVCQRCPFS